MKAIAIVGLVFAGISIFVPVGGVFLAMFCSVLALISFRSEPTLSGVAFGLNIINTAFLSPSIILSDASASGALGNSFEQTAESGDIYWSYVGFHLFLFVLAVLYKIIRKPKLSS